MSLLVKILSAMLFVLLANTCVFAETYNFLGAFLENKMVPSSFWVHGISGFKITVNVLEDKSLALKYGFRVNDLILNVDGIEVNNTKYLLSLGEGPHNIRVFRRNEFVDLNISVPLKAKTSAVKTNNNTRLPIVSANTEDLERKYGVNDKSKKNKKRSYQQCMEDEMTRSDTYEYYLNNPNTGYGYQHDRRSLDYKRARKICDEESDSVKVLIINY